MITFRPSSYPKNCRNKAGASFRGRYFYRSNNFYLLLFFGLRTADRVVLVWVDKTLDLLLTGQKLEIFNPTPKSQQKMAAAGRNLKKFFPAQNDLFKGETTRQKNRTARQIADSEKAQW
jgi:hypothetical protein